MKKLLSSCLVLLVLILLSVLLTRNNVALADGPDPQLESSASYCANSSPCDGAVSAAPGASFRGTRSAIHNPAAHPDKGWSPDAKGGPDAFGYKWSDAVPFQWIDATSGTNTNMQGYSYHQKVGPIALPFKFKYYENQYKKIYISAAGFISFTNPTLARDQGQIPDPATPNNVIAPYWSPLYLAPNGTNGKVYYKSGGTAPNRYFVVAWENVQGGPSDDDVGGNDTFRFEVVLNENGDISFQYANMSYASDYWCASSGIEDSMGAIGLSYIPYCNSMPSNRTVLFKRPKPAARVHFDSPYQGKFVAASQTAEFVIPIRNTGDHGTDTYNLTLNSSYTAALYAADGTTPLTDTNSDSIIDTGQIKQGKSATIIAKVETPGGALPGDYNLAMLTATSTIKSSVSAISNLQSAVSGGFAQVFLDRDNGAMNLGLYRSDSSSMTKVTADDYGAFAPGIVSQSNGNLLYAWNKGRCVGNNCNSYAQEIEYTLRDSDGNQLTNIQKVRNLGNPGSPKWEYDYGMNVAPNNTTGIAWVEEIYTPGKGYNDNVWFAALDSSGSLAVNPKNLTKSQDYGTTMWNARVAATTNNNFVVVWGKEFYSGGSYMDDLYYAVFDNTGQTVKSPTKLTKAKNGAAYLSPTALALADGSVFIAFTGYTPATGTGDLYYAVVGSDGTKLAKPKNLTKDQGVYDWYYADAAQASNGNIIIGWNSWDGNAHIRYAVLDSSFQTIHAPTILNNPAATVGDEAVSITVDSDDHVILTWHDYLFAQRRNLFYAMLDNTGTVMTPSMPIVYSNTYLETSFEGQGNTKH